MRPGWQLLNAGVIGIELSTTVDKMTIPTNERQIRPLARLGTWQDPQPELWKEAWAKACDLAGDKQLTEKDVETVVKQRLWKKPFPLPIGKYRGKVIDKESHLFRRC